MNSSPECLWDSIFECMLSVCNWVNQAQLKQLWSFYNYILIKLDYYDENGSSSGSGHQVFYQCIMAGIVLKLSSKTVESNSAKSSAMESDCLCQQFDTAHLLHF